MQYIKSVSLASFFLLVLVQGQAQPSFQANYDESKVPPYTLPELLKTTTNREVRDKETWEKVRRPEIITLFEENVYGQMPKAYDRLTYSIKNKNTSAMGGKATLKEVVIEVVRNSKSLKINLVLFVPNQQTGPVPVFLLINNRGKDNTDPTRSHKSDFWPAETVIDSGYAIAAIHVSDLAPDDTVNYVNGVLQLYPDQLTANDGMRAIGAWAWGASRALDYFEKDAAIDARKVVVVGHSRGGKASLWAAAEDQRFAMCVTNCSGNTGAALSRRGFGETVSRINTVFPHWFATNYKKFNNKVAELPLDQHMLIAAIAPRPLYATNATKDLWADPRGTFLSLKQAEIVYALYGIKSNLPANPPVVNHAIVRAPLGYHIREGEHNLTAFDWINFVKFASVYFKR
ncbi:alpha/beta fold hydrolase [Spirosoma utsteinense]|uniref:alpha/beta fold hydrolase n=1 Tax=Spirosoma utsteinense TaxID=2585773 RepID=UPI001644E337|nr:alpha/beta fold hydrolase [Spirosoma utsteinense]MBC3787809.1 pimeloyl-ACP methyl ester carboxylesterase [Spirosoma utsteinense]